MQTKETFIPYQRIILNDAHLAIEELRDIQDRNSTLADYRQRQNELVSAVEALSSFCIPEKTARSLKSRAQFLALTSLTRSVKAYHIAYFKHYPDHALEAKGKEVSQTIAFSKRLGIENSNVVKTVLAATPPKKRVGYLYTCLTKGEITREEADKIAEEFKL